MLIPEFILMALNALFLVPAFTLGALALILVSRVFFPARRERLAALSCKLHQEFGAAVLR